MLKTIKEELENPFILIIFLGTLFIMAFSVTTYISLETPKVNKNKIQTLKQSGSYTPINHNTATRRLNTSTNMRNLPSNLSTNLNPLF